MVLDEKKAESNNSQDTQKDPEINNNSVEDIKYIKFYNNADTDKLQILEDNKGKAGIYVWTH